MDTLQIVIQMGTLQIDDDDDDDDMPPLHRYPPKLKCVNPRLMGTKQKVAAFNVMTLQWAKKTKMLTYTCNEFYVYVYMYF